MNIKTSASAIFACILWSTAFAGIKIGLQYCSPLPFAGVRFMLSGLLLIPLWIGNKKALKRVTKNWKLIVSVAFFQTYILYSLMFWSLLYVSGTVTAIIVGSSPLLTAITTHVLTKNDKLSRKKLLSISFGIIGIVIITLNKFTVSSHNEMFLLGVILLILSSVSSAVGNIIVSTKRTTISPVTLSSFQMFIGGFMLFITGIISDGIPAIPTSPEFYLALLWLSSLSAIAFSIWFILLKQKDVKVSDLNIWKFIIPVFGAVFSWLLIPGEHPETTTVIGMIIAAGSVLGYNFAVKENNKRS